MFKKSHFLLFLAIVLLFLINAVSLAQSPSFQTYINPTIPGDHPDPTLTKIGDYFYTSGSSFNPTPKIYRSTDLVHWEVIAQPVKASWPVYGDEPGGGIWGGHMVLHNDVYWHFFGRGGGAMYFVTADQPEGPWSDPTQMKIPDSMPSGLGVDNAIFIDDDNNWYLLTKAGQENNHIVELGDDGQPTGYVLDLTWLNPNADGNPYGWAEGPVMWKHDGYYYYSFAQHLVGLQYVMRSTTLSEAQEDWTIMDGSMFYGSSSTYNRPNHISPVVELADGTSWAVAHSYNSSNSWYAHGRQGLLCQVTYNEEGFPVTQYPLKGETPAPALPSSGIPWTVARSDMFDSAEMAPDWSLLGFTPDDMYSQIVRPGWLYLQPDNGNTTVIQNDGEHNYSLITKVDFEPETPSDQAGLWIINGPETHNTKAYSTVNDQGENVFAFSYQETLFTAANTIGTVAWLKMTRHNHLICAYYSADAIVWTQIGEPIDAIAMDQPQTDFNNFTGNQQGLFVEGKAGYFDLYVYRDAYTPILAECPANQFGTSRRSSRNNGYVLGNIEQDDWAMYAGVEFGNDDYNKTPDSLKIVAACEGIGGTVEVWIDSLQSGQKIAKCTIENTGDIKTFQVFSTTVEPVRGQHDVYLKFNGSDASKIYQIQWLWFHAEGDMTTDVMDSALPAMPQYFHLAQNYPNPFNPTTTIEFSIPVKSLVSVNVHNMLGELVTELASKEYAAGSHSIVFDASALSSGIYFYSMQANEFNYTRKMLVVK